MNPSTVAKRHKNCSQCGVSFSCGAKEGETSCWCMDFPTVMPLDFKEDCRCPECLKKVIREKVDNFLRTRPSENRVVEIAMRYQGSGKPIEGIDYYLENGNWVFTEWHHWKRGHCCESGCRHCPYRFTP